MRARHGDFAMATRLEARHMRTRSRRLLRFADIDPFEQRGISERIYQAYVLIALAICAAACWLALLDSVENAAIAHAAAFASAGIPLVVAACTAMPSLLCASSLRRCPPHLQKADVWFALQGGMDAFVFLMPKLAARALLAVGLAGFAGFAAGAAVDAAIAAACPGLSASGLAFPAAIFGGCAAVCAAIVADAAGLARFLLPRKGRAALRIAAMPLSSATAVALAVAAFLLTPPYAALDARCAMLLAVAAACCIAFAGVFVFAIAVIARRINLTEVIEESLGEAPDVPWEMALFARGCYDAAIEGGRRRTRRAIGRVAFRPGALAHIQRGALSLLRRPENLAPLLIWACGIAPAASMIAGGWATPHIAIPWLALAANLLPRMHAFTSAYRSDCAVAFVRDRTPRATLGLLLLDSLPTLAVSIALSIAVAMALPLAGDAWQRMAAYSVAILLDAAVVVCAGLDATQPWQRPRRIDGQLALFGMLLCAAGLPFLLPAPATAVSLALALAAAGASAHAADGAHPSLLHLRI